MPGLSDDEYTCLAICAQGESLAAIGRWKPALESLSSAGFVHRHDIANHVITDAGRKALQERETQDEEALTQVLRKGIEVNNGRLHAKAFAEEAAQALAKAARASVIVTGDTLDAALRSWAVAVLQRANEVLDEQVGPGRRLLP